MPAAAWISLAPLAPMADTAAAWLVTYAFHSTLFLGGAWLLARRLDGRRLAVQEAVWKFALVGGLITASLQVGFGVRPLAGGWSVGLEGGDPDGSPAAATAAPSSVSAAHALGTAGATPGAEIPIAEPERPDFSGLSTPAAAPARRAAASTTPARRSTSPAPVVRFLALVTLAGGLLAAVPLLLAHLRLRHRLQGRAAVADGPLPAFLRSLERAARTARPARLTATPRLATPIARGVVHGEICLPDRALTELATAEQEGVVAHELAHLVRRDPAWLLLARAVEAVFFFQPLNRLARVRLVEIAEWRCDDWAAERTRRPLALARCLTEVAGWSLRAGMPSPAWSVAPGIVDGSSLGRRVRRLLARPAAAGAERAPRWLRPVGAAALVLVAVAAPGVTRGAAPEGTPAAGPAPVRAASPTAPTAPTPAVAATPVTEPEVAATPEPTEEPVTELESEPVLADGSRRERREQRQWHVHHERHGRAPDEVDELIDDAIEKGLDGLDERLEAALAPLDDDFDAPGGLDEDLERQLDDLEKEFDYRIDAMSDEMEELAEQMAALHLDAAHDLDVDVDLSDFGPEFERQMEAFGREMAALGQSWSDIAGHITIDPGLGERIGELVRAVVPSQEDFERIRTESERLRAEARALADEGRLTEAERERIRREARVIGELAKTDDAKLVELAEAARQLAAQLRPSAEELEAVRAAQRQAIETLRERYGAALEAQRQALEAQHQALEAQRQALERERQERERTPRDGS